MNDKSLAWGALELVLRKCVQFTFLFNATGTRKEVSNYLLIYIFCHKSKLQKVSQLWTSSSRTDSKKKICQTNIIFLYLYNILFIYLLVNRSGTSYFPPLAQLWTSSFSGKCFKLNFHCYSAYLMWLTFLYLSVEPVPWQYKSVLIQ